MDELVAELLELLRTRFGFECVQRDVRENQLRLLGRVLPAYAENWLVLRGHLINAALDADWTYDCSRPDVLRGGRGGQLTYGWRLIFQHADVASRIKPLMAIIANCPRPHFEVEEQALPGVGSRRAGVNARGGGAAPSGSMPLILQGRMGGVR
jgi:hypothetical protein